MPEWQAVETSGPLGPPGQFQEAVWDLSGEWGVGPPAAEQELINMSLCCKASLQSCLGSSEHWNEIQPMLWCVPPRSPGPGHLVWQSHLASLQPVAVTAWLGSLLVPCQLPHFRLPVHTLGSQDPCLCHRLVLQSHCCSWCLEYLSAFKVRLRGPSSSPANSYLGEIWPSPKPPWSSSFTCKTWFVIVATSEGFREG